MADRRLAACVLLVAAACGGCGGDDDDDDDAGPTFRDEHPRVYLTEDNVERLRGLVQAGDPTAMRFLDTVSVRTQVYDYSPWYSAMASVVTGDPALCVEAVGDVDAWVRGEEMLIAGGERPAIAGDSYLEVGETVADVTLVYDWCASHVSAEQRERWFAYAHQAVWNVWNHEEATWGGASFPWSGWSVDNPVNNYYYSFLEATMLFGLVARGEHPEAEGWIAKFKEKIDEQLAPTFERDLVGGGSREGTGYGVAMGELFRLYDFWEASTGERLADDTSHASESMAYLMHATVPTRDFLAPIGDHSRDSTAALYDYHRSYMLALTWLFRTDRLAAVGRTWMATSSVPEMSQRANDVYDFMYRDPGEEEPLDALALAYWAPGTGHAFARSSWADDATWIGMIAGPYTESHAHHDQLSLLLYRGGWLAHDANIYSRSGLHNEEETHNLVRLTRGSATLAMREGRSAEVGAVADRGGYFYVAADAAPVFDDDADVSRLEREVVYVRPDVVIVYDRVTASGATATWQLSTPAAPTATAGRTTAGGLVVHHVLPAATTADVTAWSQLDGDVSEGSRIDVSAPAGGAFLNVLSVDGAVTSVADAASGGDDGVTVTLAGGGSIRVRFHRDTRGGSILVSGGGLPDIDEALPDGVTRPPTFAD